VETPLSFAIHLARRTGELLINSYRVENLSTHLKTNGSIVTEADMAADRLITSSIRNCYPEDCLISEEHQTAFTQDGPLSDRDVWIIDPLDGTTNYSLGIPIWGVIITRLTGGFPEIAVLHFPVLDELYSVQRGCGAFLNNVRLQVQPPESKPKLSFFSCCSRTYKNYLVNVPYKTRIMGSAGYSMCAVAKGIAIVAFEATPKIWDIAAGWLLICEAGGVIETLDSSQPFPLKSGLDYSQKNYPTLAAVDLEVLRRTRAQILPCH
jgi:myo-inositol-1(or 4)-monophosphatase